MKNKAQKIENLLKKRFFISQTSSIYGGTAGFYDYGPLGCSLRNNILNEWRKFFTEEQNIFEVDTSLILPEVVLKASGHVDKFCDTLIFDSVNGECLRADHYLKDKVDEDTRERLDVMTLEEIDATIEKFEVLSPAGNKFAKAKHFNLMFKTHIGPQTQNTGYLRPETAQGQFLNFKKMYDLNSGKLPFGLFSIGKVFRNEISPRGGLLRVREFEQAEIEYFVHPNEKVHEKYDSVKNTKLDLHYGAEIQTTISMTLSEAVDRNLIKNKCIAYFIGLTANFFKSIGLKKFRFRQHKKDEMAHYASDCWDAEVLLESGWVESVGIADRSCYDLSQHSQFSGSNLYAQRLLPEPKKVTVVEPIMNTKEWGKKYKNKSKLLIEKIKNLRIDETKNDILTKEIEFEDDIITIQYERKEVMIYKEDFIPTVIEPSFGIGRILSALIEQSYTEREEDSNRSILALPPQIAPYQVFITSLITKDHKKSIQILSEEFKRKSIRHFIITQNVSIGRRYAQADEIGTPFFITFDTENDKMVTIRERDSTKQIRVLEKDVVEKIVKLVGGSAFE